MILLFAGCMTLDGFFFNGTPLDAYALGDDVIPAECQEEVSWPADDGTMLYGVWAHQGACGGADDAPLLVYFHGNADNIDAYWHRVELYWSYGYETFIWDYRGYGKSEGDPTWDHLVVDGTTTLDFVAASTGKDREDLNVLALSLGGFVALRAIQDVPPRRLVLEDVFANVQKMLDDGTDLGIPAGWVVVDDWDNLGPASTLDPDLPVLVMHGDHDTYIEPEHAELLYAALSATTKDLWFVEGADHADDAETDPTGYQLHVNCWVEQPDPSGCIGTD